MVEVEGTEGPPNIDARGSGSGLLNVAIGSPIEFSIDKC